MLAGAGARAAYEAGALSALTHLLTESQWPRPPLDLFCGMSMGAFNAAWLTAHAREPGWNTGGLLRDWHGLSLEQAARPPGSRWRGLLAGLREGMRVRPWSMLAPELLIRRVEQLPWTRLRGNLGTRRVRGLLIPCYRLDTNETVVFSELASELAPSQPPGGRTRMVSARIGLPHVLASCALPGVLPARRIGDGTYCDGTLRFGTPLAPALWCGAQRLVVISTACADSEAPAAPFAIASGPAFVAGKLLDGLVLDPLAADLRRLEAINARVEDGSAAADHRAIGALVLRPSTDLGVVAGAVAAELRRKHPARRIWSMLAELNRPWQADLYSYVLLDEEYTRTLTALGRSDTFARADEVLDFFGRAARPLQDACS